MRDSGFGIREKQADDARAAASPNPGFQQPNGWSSRIPNPAPKRIALCAGEASGDLLGAGLIEQLRTRFPDAQFAGIGGDAMRTAGFEAWHGAQELAVMGFAEVLAHLPRLLKLRRRFRQRVLDWKPDAFIGIDAPDFNLGVEKWLKQRGVRTVHYVSPSVWAWREKRAEKIGQSADRVLCLFPMEPAIYARHDVDARFVGHPLADAMPLEPDRAAARAQLGLDADAPVLALLPGSRLGEISRLGAPFLAAAAKVAGEIPGLQVVIPAANAACRQALEALLSGFPALDPRPLLLDGQARTAMVAADVVLLASGTATLEAMLAKRPMVVGYRIAPLTHAIVKGMGMLKVDRYALPNVLAGADLAPELMQHDCTPGKLAEAVLGWFRNPGSVASLQARYLEIHEELRQDASSRAADAVAELVGDVPRG
ncbi:lipid-A-disaccharide synthase [Luteimonas soli]|uniref:Lipid-A-disaccharide synthase n=1 Tax=Luteimonas soli TaxID=1648966 RepID=A0ABV7XQ75_9GAMM